jgi:hypothetical protein
MSDRAVADRLRLDAARFLERAAVLEARLAQPRDS